MLRPTLALPACMIGGLAAVPAAASHAEHYDEAMQCYVVTTFVSGLTREGGQALPDNSDSGRSLAAPYMPVLAYEGTRMGMTVEEISEDIDSTYSAYSERTLARLNALQADPQTDLFNQIVDEANACGGIPTFSPAAE